MPDGEMGQFDFSDLGGQRVGQALDFSDLGGQRVGEADEQPPTEGFFGKFADLGAISVENHPEWVEGWRASASTPEQPQRAATPRPSQRATAPTPPSQPPNEQTRPLDFSDIGGRRVNLSQTAPSQPDKPGFSQRWAEGMGIPVTQEEEDAMREEMKPKWYDLVAPQWRGLKMVGGMVKNAWEQQKQAAQDAIEAGRNIGKGEDVLPNLVRSATSNAEHNLKSLPFGEQLWNFGQDVHEGNWGGAAGGATAGFLQAALMDAMGGERSSAPEAPPSATPYVRPTIPAEETVPTPRPVAETPGQPVGKYESESSAPASRSTEPQRGRIAGPQKGVRPRGGEAAGEFPEELPVDLQKLLEKANPTGSRENCGRCVDVFARTLNGDESFAEEGDDFQVRHLEDKYGPFRDANALEIKGELLADGEGAHAIIKGEFRPGPDGKVRGHVFNAVHWNDGKVYFVDPQNGKAVTLQDLQQYERLQYIRSD